MRRAITALLASALASVALGGAVLASTGTTPDLELTVKPDNPKPGDAVLIQAYVHFGTKPYQGATVEFQVFGPGMKSPVTLHGKPGEAGYYRAQFTPQGAGDFAITTLVDGNQVVSKPYHLQVTGQAVNALDGVAMTAGAAALALLIFGAFLIRQRRVTRAIPATN